MTTLPKVEPEIKSKELLNPNRKVPKSKDMVYVFETDLAGTHRSPSARTAIKHYNAVRYRASGLQGRSYGVPLYNYDGTTPLNVVEIKGFIEEFIEYARNQPEKSFKISPLGQMSQNHSLVGHIVRTLKNCPDNCYLDDTILIALGIIKKVLH